MNLGCHDQAVVSVRGWQPRTTIRSVKSEVLLLDCPPKRRTGWAACGQHGSCDGALKACQRKVGRITAPPRRASTDRHLGLAPRTNSQMNWGQPWIPSRLTTADRDWDVSGAWPSALRLWVLWPAAVRLQPPHRPRSPRRRRLRRRLPLLRFPLRLSPRLRLLGPPRR
jgi:hypothetical protein